VSDRSPLHDALARAGAAFTDEAGWRVPADFGDPEAEYRAARRGAALFDLSHRGKLELTGPEAAAFLHNLLTNDVNGLPAGAGREAFLCNAQARVLARALVWRGGDAGPFWLDVDPGGNARVYAHLDRHRISERVEVADRTAELAQLHLAGPAAGEILARLGLPQPAELRCAPAVSLAQQVRRHGALGLPGFDLIGPPEAAVGLWRCLVSAGARPAGRDAYEVLRIEAGTPAYGPDLDEGTLAPEAGRTPQAISYTKGCYLGQEPIVRVRDLGHVNRVLTGVRIDGREAVPRGARLWRDGKVVGHVTSAAYSPGRGAVVGLAYVRRGSTDPGTPLEAETAGGRRPAAVAALPQNGG
jgi:folate-binding protein YgfZ